MKEIMRVDQKFLENFGSGSLIGQLKNFGPTLKEVCLVFPQTSLEWKRNNNGPDNWIVLEHAIPCLIQDIIALIQNHNINVSCEMREGDR